MIDHLPKKLGTVSKSLSMKCKNETSWDIWSWHDIARLLDPQNNNRKPTFRCLRPHCRASLASRCLASCSLSWRARGLPALDDPNLAELFEKKNVQYPICCCNWLKNVSRKCYSFSYDMLHFHTFLLNYNQLLGEMRILKSPFDKPEDHHKIWPSKRGECTIHNGPTTKDNINMMHRQHVMLRNTWSLPLPESFSNRKWSVPKSSKMNAWFRQSTSNTWKTHENHPFVDHVPQQKQIPTWCQKALGSVDMKLNYQLHHLGMCGLRRQV